VREAGYELFPISAVTGAGVPELLEAAWRHIARPERSRGAAGTPALPEASNSPVSYIPSTPEERR
jgi:hypothetical protein